MGINQVDKNYEGKKINVFWTGGWDSTYRVVELSRQNVAIEPIYILDDNRPSNKFELEAIRKITYLLRNRPETIADIKDLKIIKVKEIPEDKKITEAAKVLAKEHGLGVQHDWTARVAKMFPGIEMCIEKALPTAGYTPIRDTLNKYATLTWLGHGYGLSRASNENVRLIFKDIVLPIFETTEEEMLANIREIGYEDVMKNIWFCHTPIHGKPCGMCSPCHTKMESNMSFLLPTESIRRFDKAEEVNRKYGRIPYMLYKKVYRKFCGAYKK